MINKKRFSYLLISVFLVFAFVAIAEVQAQPSDISKLKAKAAREGQVLVIVGLNLPGGFTPEGHLHGNKVAQQRKAIADIRKALKDSLHGFNAKVSREWDSVPSVAVGVDNTALEYLENSPLVATIQEDLLVDLGGGWDTAVIGADATWRAGLGGRGQTVVILDDGIDANHSFFGGRVVAQACFSNAGGIGGGVTLCPNGADSQTGDASADVTIGQTADVDHCDTYGANHCGHGTSVAGVAAGKDPGGIGYSGVAPEANIIAIQVCTRYNDDASCGGTGRAPCLRITTSDLISALDYVNNNLRQSWNISSVNMSLGGGKYTSACDDAIIKTAIDNLLSNGIATCIASGNDRWTDALWYPACVSTAVTVGGADVTNIPLEMFTYVIYNMHSLVDLLAIGSGTSSIPVNAWGWFGGTSMATPQVAGAFAVIRSIALTKSIADILGLLQTMGVPVKDNRPPNPEGSATGTTKPLLQLIAAVPVSYTIEDLGTLGGTESIAYDINNHGQVVGASRITGDTAYHAFLYSDGTMQDLGTLAGGTDSFAYGINNLTALNNYSAQVVGGASTDNSPEHAFLYSGGTMYDLGTLGGWVSYAEGINDAGWVVGSAWTTGNTAYHAFRYNSKANTIEDSGTLGGTNSGFWGINNAGQVVGGSDITGNSIIDNGAYHAFEYDGTTMQDLGTLGGTKSWAYGINNAGQVVGEAQITADTAYHAFLYSDGTMQDLGTLVGLDNSMAKDINNAGQVVGGANSRNTSYRAFLYDGGTMYELSNWVPSSAGWELLDGAGGINDSGQIVGSGIINGARHAYLLTPAFATPLGMHVTVSPLGSGASIHFPWVYDGGYTSTTISKNGPALPAGFQLLGNYYDVATTAGTSSSVDVTVCITDPDVSATSVLLHYESGNWVDVTITPVSPPTICAKVSSLSLFVIARIVPSVAVCQNVTAAAGSNCTASASIDNGSYDPRGNPITLTQSPEGPYPLGSYEVTLTMTDSYGLSSQCTGTVTVIDNTPPTLTCPVPKEIDAITPSGASSRFRPTVSDNCSGTTVSCTPASGSVFPIGVTPVSCSATDQSANLSSCSFTVTVRGAAEQSNNLTTLVKSFNLPKGISGSLVSKLSDVESLLTAGKTIPVCNVVNAFINEALAQSGKKITEGEADQLITNAMRIKAAAGCP